MPAFFELVHHAPLPPGFCPHELLLADGKEHSQEIHEDSLKGDFLVTASPLHNSSGTLIGSVHIMHDITDRKRAENALQLALKKLTMLSSITRHDIQNQLMGLRAYFDFFKENITDPELLGFISKEETAVGAIGRQIEFTRYYENIGVHAPQWQDISSLIRSSTSQLPADTSALTITFSGVEVFADPLIGTVFYNLMENSLRHGGTITQMSFSFYRNQEYAVVTYWDNGIGIPHEDKGHIFQRGFGNHTGLGLFLSREILSITGITLRENGKPGKGVRFEILIPHDMYRIVPETEGSL